MNRVATTFALSSWLGFVVVSAASTMAQGAFQLGAPLPDGARLALPMLLMSAVAMLVSLLDLHGKAIDRRARGEWLGMAGLLLVAAVACAGSATGRQFLSANTTGAAFWLLLALAIAALVFDRTMSVEDSPDKDDEAFHAAIAAISATMADEAHSGPGQKRPNRNDKKP